MGKNLLFYGKYCVFVDLKAINRGKDDKRGYLKFYFGIASLFKFNSDILFAKVLLFHVPFGSPQFVLPAKLPSIIVKSY